MNIAKVKKLSDEELRLKVAEICGFTDIQPIDYGTCDIEDIGAKFEGISQEEREIASKKATSPENYENFANYSSIPDYTNDLNAMNKVEEILFEKSKAGLYKEWLYRTTGDNINLPIWRASARHRAEAFVLTILSS